MKFGIKEILEYAKDCTDEKVLVIIKRLHEARRKNCLANEQIRKLENQNQSLRRLLSNVNIEWTDYIQEEQ